MHLKVGFVSMAVVAATVSASSFQVMNPLTARGTCDSVCNLITAADTQCKAETNYDKCFCTSTNLMNLDNCYACLVLDVEANAKANSILTGDSTAVGADSLKADGERAHKRSYSRSAISLLRDFVDALNRDARWVQVIWFRSRREQQQWGKYGHQFQHDC
ncbi:hypothetical protein MD484_g6088, partial [Candolleomyces efflorescens]